MTPAILATVAAIAVAKRGNREIEAARKVAMEEAAQRRIEARQQEILEKTRRELLTSLLEEDERISALENFLVKLDRAESRPDTRRVGPFMEWAHARLDAMRTEIAPASIERRLADLDGTVERAR